MRQSRRVRRSTTTATGRLLTVAIVAAVLCPGLPVVDAVSPAEAAPVGSACPARRVPATAYTDTVRSVHRAAIDCAAWWGVAQGTSATSFRVNVDVTRAQAAAMVARLLATTDHAVTDPPSAGFRDTAGHRFEDEIDLLAHLGILRGVTSTRFVPDASLSRQQMASILVRMLEQGYELALPTGTLPFRDVVAGSTHAGAIAKLVASDITRGTTATTFDPRGSVLRGQMASFLMRSTSRIVAAGEASLPTARPGPDDPFASRTRGAWVHLFDGTLKTRTSIRRMVAELAAADVNQINVQVARRYDAYFFGSGVLPRTVDPTLERDLDVLREVHDAANPRGIRVHAWIAVAPTWHPVYDGLPAPAGWVPREHGITAPVADRWVTRTVDGTWSTYLDPGLPEVQDLVRRVVGELLTEYQLEGIHLDYVRYESNRHGYHPRALARFRAETGFVGTPTPTDPSWSAWRRAQTQRIVTTAQTAAARIAPSTDISAAVISWGDGPRPADRRGFLGSRAHRDVLQDWDTWARSGHVDQVSPMNYFRSAEADQLAWYRQWLTYEQGLAGASPATVVPGVAGYLNTPAAVLSQVSEAMHAADGALVYSVQQPTLDGDRSIWTTLSDTRWGYPPRRAVGP